MTARYGAPLISGAAVYGDPGLGVLGSVILAETATGDHGAGYLYNDVDSGDEAKEFRGLIVTPPAAGTFFAYENGSYTLTGAPDGAYSFVYRLYVDGADLGTATASITVGAASGITGTSSITLGAITSAATGASSISGASAITLGTITSTAAGSVTDPGANIGSSSITLGAIVSVAAGTSTITGSSSITLGAITSSGPVVAAKRASLSSRRTVHMDGAARRPRQLQ